MKKVSPFVVDTIVYIKHPVLRWKSFYWNFMIGMFYLCEFMTYLKVGY